MPAAAKIALAAASFVFGLVGLALSIALSPLTASLLLIAFLACVVVFLFRLFRRHPVLWWAAAASACFVQMVGFSG